MDDDEAAFFDAIEREQLVHDVNNEITLYQNTGDARFFWRAFLTLREAGEPIPEDFLSKLAQWGSKLIRAQTPTEIASALELGGDEKRHIGPAHSAAYYKRWRLASEVQTMMKMRPTLKLAEAIRIVAKNSGMTTSKVKADYHKVFTAPVSKAGKSRANKGHSLNQAMNAWR